MRRLPRGTARAWATATAAALLFAGTTWIAIDFAEARARVDERSMTERELADARDQLDRELKLTLAVPETVAAFVASQARIDPASAAFKRIADSNRHLRKIQFMAEKVAPVRTIVHAPIRLAGGGLGLESDTPVMRRVDTIGTVPATISADSLFDVVGFRRPAAQDRFELAVRGAEASSASGKFLAGAPQVFSGEPVLLDYLLPGGERWELAAIPAGGWIAAARVPPWVKLLAFIGALAIGFAAYKQVRASQRAGDRMKFIEDLFESVPAALAMRDLNGRYMYVNRTWERVFSAPRENVIGKHVRERVPDEEAEALLAMDRSALAGGRGNHERQEMIFRGRHYSQVRSVMSDAHGERVGVVIANIDTTDRFILEQTLATQARQLEARNEALKENVRLREEVDRIGRHDLKTPLNSILAVPRLLREGRALSREELDLINIVERAGYRILNMVNLSLDLFKMEAGTYRFNPQPVDLMDVMGKVMVDVVDHAESKNVTLKTIVDGKASTVQTPVYAWGDELLCYSMLGNLVKNAIEAAPEGGCVSISLEGPRDVVMLRIHNPGAVPESIRDHFFEKYASAGKPESTGLGTYSARLMARTQGGDISMRTSQEAGTTIAIWLRAAPASAMPEPGDQPRGPLPPAALAPLRALHVLVVDDDEFNRLIVRRYLPPPLRVATAVNGRAAAEAAAASPPAAILMDLDMPIMDGYEAVAGIRAAEREARKRSTIIALSSHDDDETRARCLASGFDYYLTKPVTRELLHQTLAKFAAAAGEVSAPETSEVEIDEDMRDMIPDFIASRRELALQMQAALRNGDREQVRRTAHQLAGSFALYGFHWAADHCKRLELDAAAGDADRLGEMIARLRDHLESVEVTPAA